MNLFHSLFGPSRKKIYAQLAAEVDGELVESGIIWKKQKVVRTFRAWIITLDNYVVSDSPEGAGHNCTRMRTPLKNSDGFSFSIYRKSIFSTLGKLLGMQDVQVGHDAFDEAFIVKANDEGKVKQLLHNDRIREVIEAQEGVKFELKESALQLDIEEDIKDVKRLKDLFHLFDETLIDLFGS